MAQKAVTKKAAQKAATKKAAKKSTAAAPAKSNRTSAKKSTGGKVLKLAAPVKPDLTLLKKVRRPKVIQHLLCVLDMLTNYRDIVASVIHIDGGPYITKVMGPATKGFVQIAEFTTYKEAHKMAVDFVKDVEGIVDMRASDMLDLEYQNMHSLNAVISIERGEKQRSESAQNSAKKTPENPTLANDKVNEEKVNPPQINATNWRENVPTDVQVVCSPTHHSFDAANREVYLNKVSVNAKLFGYEVTVNGVCVCFTHDADQAEIEFHQRLEHAGQ